MDQRSRDEVDLLSARLSRLERENRSFRLIGGLGVVLILAALLGSAALDDASEIKATRFTLVDANGQESAVWTALKPEEGGFGEAYMLFFSSPHRQLRVALSGGDRPHLLMNGGGDLMKDGRLGHIKLATDADFGPHLFLWGQNRDQFASEDTSVRSTHLTTPWGGSPQCLEVEVADSVKYTAP